MTKHLFVVAALTTLAVGCATEPTADDPAYSLSDSGKADSGWSHLDFTSVEGASIRVDYQIASSQVGDQYLETATPLWINVQRASLEAANGVHVWIGDESWISKEGYDNSAKYNELQVNADASLDLYRSDDATRFTGQLANGLAASNFTNGDDEAWYHAHQFAIVIDNEWQTDPISGTHNFLSKSLFDYNAQ